MIVYVYEYFTKFVAGVMSCWYGPGRLYGLIDWESVHIGLGSVSRAQIDPRPSLEACLEALPTHTSDKTKSIPKTEQFTTHYNHHKITKCTRNAAMDNSNATFALTTEQNEEIIQEGGTALDFYRGLSGADRKKVRDNNGNNSALRALKGERQLILKDCEAKKAALDILDSKIKQITAETNKIAAEVARPYDIEIAVKEAEILRELAVLKNLKNAKITAECVWRELQS